MEFPLTLQSAPWPVRRFDHGDLDERALRLLTSAPPIVVAQAPARSAGQLTRTSDAPPKPGRAGKKTATRQKSAPRSELKDVPRVENAKAVQPPPLVDVVPAPALLEAARAALQDGGSSATVVGAAGATPLAGSVPASPAAVGLSATVASAAEATPLAGSVPASPAAVESPSTVADVAVASPSEAMGSGKRSSLVAARKRRARELAEREQELLREASERAERERALARLHDLREQQERREAEDALQREAAHAKSLEERVRAAAELDSQRLREYQASVQRAAAPVPLVDAVAMELAADTDAVVAVARVDPDVSFEETRAEAMGRAMDLDSPASVAVAQPPPPPDEVSFEEARAAAQVTVLAVAPRAPAVEHTASVSDAAPAAADPPAELSAAAEVASPPPTPPVAVSPASLSSSSSSSSSSLPPPAAGSDYHLQFKLHQVVRVLGADGKAERGMLAYLGPVDFAPGVWAGVILGAAIGKNDGSVKGRRFFKCDARFGVMVPCVADRIAPWDASAVAARVSPHASTAAHVERVRRARGAKGK